jgi:hypothetical protein
MRQSTAVTNRGAGALAAGRRQERTDYRTDSGAELEPRHALLGFDQGIYSGAGGTRTHDQRIMSP